MNKEETTGEINLGYLGVSATNDGRFLVRVIAVDGAVIDTILTDLDGLLDIAKHFSAASIAAIETDQGVSS